MVIGPAGVLKRNYQRHSTNRFIVDSPRFWRVEFHPRFSDIFDISDFIDVFNDANSVLSFPIPAQSISKASAYLWAFFSSHRFSCIPAKQPNGKEMFLADLYFTLLDYLPQIQWTDYPLDRDSFNVIGHRAETGKNDTSKVATAENNTQNSSHETELDILSQGKLNQQSESGTENTDGGYLQQKSESGTENIDGGYLQQKSELGTENMDNGTIRQTDHAHAENIDELTDQNTKTVNDVFLSPQNLGVKPITQNTRHKGVDGIDINPGGSFTTNTANNLMGDSIKRQANTSDQSQQAESEQGQQNKTDQRQQAEEKQEQQNKTDQRNQAEEKQEQQNKTTQAQKLEEDLTQNNDAKTRHGTDSGLQMGQEQENTTAKNDNYVETLAFDEAKQLQEFYDLSKDRLWLNIIGHLARWILQVNIANAEYNYLECETYG